jgi:hypothetical protein
MELRMMWMQMDLAVWWRFSNLSRLLYLCLLALGPALVVLGEEDMDGRMDGVTMDLGGRWVVQA